MPDNDMPFNPGMMRMWRPTTQETKEVGVGTEVAIPLLQGSGTHRSRVDGIVPVRRRSDGLGRRGVAAVRHAGVRPGIDGIDAPHY